MDSGREPFCGEVSSGRLGLYRSTPMRKLLSILILSSLPVLALDEKPLLQPGAMEAGVYSRYDATYQMLDGSWNYYSAPSPSAPTSFGLTGSFKYGMNESSDLEVVIPWVLRDADWSVLQGRKRSFYTGFDRIDLTAKIQLAKWGAGPLAGFSFPLGNERVVGFSPEWGFTFGGWGGIHRANRWIDGLATWSITPKNSSGFRPGDRQLALFNAGIQLDEGIAPTFGMQWDRQGVNDSSGRSRGVERQRIQALPGCVLQLDEDWNLEVKVPVVFAGRNTYGTFGLSLGIVGSFEP